MKKRKRKKSSRRCFFIIYFARTFCFLRKRFRDERDLRIFGTHFRLLRFHHVHSFGEAALRSLETKGKETFEYFMTFAFARCDLLNIRACTRAVNNESSDADLRIVKYFISVSNIHLSHDSPSPRRWSQQAEWPANRRRVDDEDDVTWLEFTRRFLINH